MQPPALMSCPLSSGHRGSLPGVPELPSATSPHLAPQPSGAAFPCLHLINSPSHFILPQKMSLFSSVSLAPWPKIPVCLSEYTVLGLPTGSQSPGAGLPGGQRPGTRTLLPQHPLITQASSCRQGQVGATKDLSAGGWQRGPSSCGEGEQAPWGHHVGYGGALAASTPRPVRETDGSPRDILRESSPRVEITPVPAWLSVSML